MLLVGIALILIGIGLIYYGVTGSVPAALVIGILVLVIGAAVTFGAYDDGDGNPDANGRHSVTMT